ncbi:MAG: MmgE/PrpD family protein [Xanthobacteraceae bacterium]|nr:MmgE/PrpD family protein [Xanthobacteraceae bacterium]
MASLETLGAYVARDIRNQVSGDARGLLALHLTDTLTAWVATRATREAQVLRKFQSDAKPGETDVGIDILVNCALTRLSEVDDIHLASMITPGSIVIPGALAIAAQLPPDPVALSEAIVAGYEAMVRLGLAVDGPSILYRGIWPTYLAAPFGIAAVAARLLDLSAEEGSHALALALTLAAPGVGHHNAPTGSRWFAAGSAARNGLIAAQAARSGITSDLNLLEGSFFNAVFNILPKADALIEGLGASTKLADVSFKPWCAARQTMAATQALREIMDEGVAAADMVTVDVAVPPPFLKMVDHGIVGGRTARLTSQPYQIAVAAIAPDLAFDVGQSGDVPVDVVRFMNKVTVRADESMLHVFPGQWPARVHVRTASAEHDRVVQAVCGDPRRSFDLGDVITKSRRLIGVLADDVADRCEAVFAGRITAAELLAFVDEACARKS